MHWDESQQAGAFPLLYHGVLNSHACIVDKILEYIVPASVLHAQISHASIHQLLATMQVHVEGQVFVHFGFPISPQ